MHHEDMWRLWLASAAGQLPLHKLQARTVAGATGSAWQGCRCRAGARHAELCACAPSHTAVLLCNPCRKLCALQPPSSTKPCRVHVPDHWQGRAAQALARVASACLTRRAACSCRQLLTGQPRLSSSTYSVCTCTPRPPSQASHRFTPACTAVFVSHIAACSARSAAASWLLTLSTCPSRPLPCRLLSRQPVAWQPGPAAHPHVLGRHVLGRSHPQPAVGGVPRPAEPAVRRASRGQSAQLSCTWFLIFADLALLCDNFAAPLSLLPQHVYTLPGHSAIQYAALYC